MSGNGPRALSHTEIAGCFNASLGRTCRVRLVGGGAEPLYLPDPGGWSVIRYTRDHPASVLHELAHWCIAGAGRRRSLDYGYWYVPPPRSPSQQAAFARVEVPVQALESRFAAACGLDFRVSVDDLDGPPETAAAFAREVAAHAAGSVARVGVRARILLQKFADFRRALGAGP